MLYIKFYCIINKDSQKQIFILYIQSIALKDEKQRLRLIYGDDAVENINKSKGLIVGLGGVDSYTS